MNILNKLLEFLHANIQICEIDTPLEVIKCWIRENKEEIQRLKAENKNY